MSGARSPSMSEKSALRREYFSAFSNEWARESPAINPSIVTRESLRGTADSRRELSAARELSVAGGVETQLRCHESLGGDLLDRVGGIRDQVRQNLLLVA